MGYRTVKWYVFSNLHTCCFRSSKNYREVVVDAETILEAKKKVKRQGYKDLKFERINVCYERI